MDLYRAAGYRRVSMREQVDGYSLDAQTTHIKQYAQANGWTLIDIYTDAGISAKKDSERPALAQLLSDARAHKFDVIIVDKIDRFYRHLGGLLVALDQLNAWGVTFASVQEHLDFTTPWGKLMLTVLGMLAEIYIDNLRQETRKGKQQRAREGLWNGLVPFGYCKGLCSHCTDPNGPGYCPNVGQPDQSNGKVLIPHPIDSVAVRLAYEAYVTGEYSDATIADLLNTHEHRLDDGRVMHFRLKGVPGRFDARPFSTDAVRGLLQRVIYAGQVVYYGSEKNGVKRRRKEAHESYPGQQPALIDQITFDRVQELRSLFANNGRVRKGAAIQIYPLTGLARCGYCGNHLRGISPHSRRYYQDAARIEHTVECPQRLTRAEPIEQQVVERLKVALTNIDVAASDALKDRLVAADLQVTRAQELYLLGEIGREVYDAAKNAREKLVENWGLHFSDFNATIPFSLINTALADWSGTLPIEQKRLLRLMIEGVYVRGDAVVAVQPTLAFLPLLGNHPGCTYGPDGRRTRR